MLKIPQLKSDFTKNVLKLISGTALAHVTTFIALPILTRLFSKESLGLWQIYISTITTFGVVASLKFEMAIVIPKDDEESDQIAVLSLAALGVFSLFFTALLALFGDQVLGLLNAQELEPFLYYIALGVFLFGLWQAVQYILVRRKRFGILATNKVIQVGTTQILAVVLGLFWQNAAILLYAQMAGYALAAWAIMRMRLFYPRCSFIKMWELTRRYKKFPTVNTAMVFLNTLSLQLPVFMFSRYFTPEIVALYSMAMRIVNIPLFMVGRSVQQVYFAGASEARHESTEKLLDVYKSTVKKLSLFALAPLLILLFLGPWIADLYLGDGFREAGVYMQIITFWMFFQFINSPISSTFTIIDKQQVGVYLILFSLIARFAAMVAFSATPRMMLTALSITAGLFYLCYNVSIYYFIKRDQREDLDV